MRLVCVGVRMVVILISPILVVDNRDLLRAGRCRTSLKIPIWVWPFEGKWTLMSLTLIASMVQLSATQICFGGSIFQ